MKRIALSKKLIIAVLFALVLAGCGGKDKNDSEDWSTSGNIMDLQPMKDQFSKYFMMGNIAAGSDYSGGQITNQKLIRHYNILTAENNMKPSTYGGSRSGTTVSGLTYANSDAFVNAAIASGFKVHAHVLLWHQQNSGWITNVNSETNKDTAIAAMNSYITQVASHFKGKIYSWDVLNELFNDSGLTSWKNSMRANNPWAKAIGSDFVYEGFKAVRLVDGDAILYYNDYNLDNATKANMVRDMVQEVNNQWKTDSDNKEPNRLLIEGIGMQSHHNTGVSANAVKASLDKFKPLGVKISISELDVLSQNWNEYSNSVTPNENGKTAAANLYGQFFALFLQYSDIIERVTFWGVYDEQSWRARGLPLPFSGNSATVSKPAYGRIIEALKAHEKR